MKESDEQKIIFEWAKMMEHKYPQLKFMFATQNGLRLTIGQAVKAKKQGMNKGAPDIVLPWPNKNNHGLFIELKVGTNKPSKEQIEFIDFLNTNNYKAEIAYGSKEAIDFIIDYIEDFI